MYELANCHLKIKDYSLKIHKSAYHLFSVLISKRGFSSLQTRKTFSKILWGNYRFLIPITKSDATQLRIPIRVWINCNAMFYEKKLFVSMSVKQNLSVSVFVHKQMFDDVQRC